MSIKEFLVGMMEDLSNGDLESLEKKHYLCKSLQKKIIDESFDIFNPHLFIQNALDIEGLFYIPNYLSTNELAMIKEKIVSDIYFQPITTSKFSRKVAHYGYYYSYDRSGLHEAPPIPDYLMDLVVPDRINQIIGSVLIEKPFEQLIINEYKPGQQIGHHVDHKTQFGPIIACITIGQSVPIQFKLSEITKIIKPEEGSLYLMTGDARYKWSHSLKNTLSENRYSLTYRTIC